jgi:hypothetical protein
MTYTLNIIADSLKHYIQINMIFLMFNKFEFGMNITND